MAAETLKFFFGVTQAPKPWGWFWGLWDNLWVRDTRPPLLCGFEGHKKLALAQVKRLVCEPYLREQAWAQGIETFVANQTGVDRYAKSYLENSLWPATANPFENTRYAFLQNKDAPVWAIAPTTGGWYWAVWPSLFHYFATGEPVAQGEELSQQEASLKAFSQVGKKPGQGLPPGFGPRFLGRRLCAQQWADSGAPLLSPNDFLYGNRSPNFIQVQQEWTAHQIVKESERFLWVLQRPFPFLKTPDSDPTSKIGQVYKVSHSELKAQGQAFCREYEGYFQTAAFQGKPTARPQKPVPPLDPKLQAALKLLALPQEFDQGQLKKQYHQLLFVHHPDHGGEAANFVALKKAFVLAKSALEQKEARLPKKTLGTEPD
ncbi:MAG: hypothetical protein A2600_08710 [Candidatus Lambdaproteobacteria bacterium RIFOXYD1_FULL_56_27]|uniref:J domain-containing protein n=1 Tax=Candidatus Lambdaproteobacteria bacterium RIFOXYD2_FULL_56_26 TaxID=1817773 RepID=A0A1F6GYY8_9PROT|nr:MAG: hypothetical protein A2426_10130 [Candidatus Lambdaproteobacteria bacterium RIFOXYC1_FULL_56_13]OGH03383.1 MAG: hypothetical protein A2557_02555 [Candidatus Lambdaproteobacteria bacterium RIFOXYD2_FULL_56_26]OGH06612.1 MAG: hypothetical protein A2600_08710 [Candidatus Lambdaproteobacteria bacterium RIFOXYD1_FULL_56_27]